MEEFLFWVKNYVHKACNPTILNLSISLKKLQQLVLEIETKSLKPTVAINPPSIQYFILPVDGQAGSNMSS